MGDIHLLPGCGPIAPQATLGAVGDVVELLEKTLADALAGRVRAIGLAIVRDGGTTTTAYALHADEATSHQLTAATAYLHGRYVAHKLEQSVEPPADPA